MHTIRAMAPCLAPPAWAVLERALIDAMGAAVEPFLAKYTRADGSLIWGATAADHGRDDVDDFYEACSNWPLLYLLGGDERLLELGMGQWEAITRQLSAMGLLHREFERGADQFHQGESLIYLYFLCMADPERPRLRELAERFARFYTGDDAEAPNYDPELRIIRAPHNGGAGPRWGYHDGTPEELFRGWDASMARYGLPFHDVPGVRALDDLRAPEGARAMWEAMQARYGQGDTAANLAVTSLVTNAFLLTGDERYRAWVCAYTDAWRERAAANGGLVPDNVGLDGRVGSHMGGRWYGGLYGWTWPHGFYNIGMATAIAGANAFLLSGERRYLDLPRWQIEGVLAEGVVADPDGRQMSLAHHHEGLIARDGQAARALLVPYRYGDEGWFDYQPLGVTYPVALWNVSHDPADHALTERLRALDPHDWRDVWPGRGKEDGGHEAPWLRFLAGESPGYPEHILAQSLGHVYRRLELIRQDTTDLMHLGEKNVHYWVHLWQNMNPVTTEALVQLTLGAPQFVYNGGLLHAPLRYYDGERRRPGLPPDVAALVDSAGPGGVSLHLVNLSPLHERTVVIQAGAFAEHRWLMARYPERVSDYPGDPFAYQAPPPAWAEREMSVDDTWLAVALPPGHELRLRLTAQRHVSTPTYRGPWSARGSEGNEAGPT